MKKTNFSELLGAIARFIPIIGMIVIVLTATINLVFFQGNHQILNYAFIVGAIALMLPIFTMQFFLPAGFLEVPFWGKVMFYLLMFPFANMWILSTADAAFHFLPNFREAMMTGKDILTVQAMRQEWVTEGWKIVGIMYFSMIAAGLLFRVIFGKKFQEKIAY